VSDRYTVGMTRTRHTGKLWWLRKLLREDVRLWQLNEKHCRGLCCERPRKPEMTVMDHLEYESRATE